MVKKRHIYRIIFLNQGTIYELYARSVYSSDLYGFVEVEQLIFGEKSALVVDPSEERIQSEFAGVKRFMVPLHSVVRVDEVEKEGAAKIIESGEGVKGNVTPFPAGIPPANRN